MKYFFKETFEFPRVSKKPGYILVAGEPDLYKARNIITSSLTTFFGGYGSEAHILDNEKYVLCILKPEKLSKLDICSLYHKANDICFIEGTFYESKILNKQKIAHNAEFDSCIAEFLFASFSQNNINFLKNLNGHYSGFIYLSAKDTLYCFNDKFGVNKIFYYDNSRYFALSNNIFALSKNNELDIDVNKEAICQILQLDYPFDRNSEFSNIYHLLPNEILVRTNNSISLKILDCYQFCRDKRGSFATYFEALTESFNLFFREILSILNENLGIFLSRGKDSRILLHFLKQHSENYSLFNFLTNRVALAEFKDIKKIAIRLAQPLFVLDEIEIDRNKAIMAGMNTTADFSWLALAYLASNYVNYALIGFAGDGFSGKLMTFRSFPKLKSKKDLITAIYYRDSKGLSIEELIQQLPFFSKYKYIKEKYIDSIEDYEGDSLYDIELKHKFLNRWFRHTMPILNKSSHLITPIYPFIDKTICNKYFNLPVEFIKNQELHTCMAALEKASKNIPSTEFPIPLKIERFLRPLMQQAIKINHFSNNRALNWQSNKSISHNSISTDYQPASSYFRETLGKVIHIKSHILLHRIQVVDLYLHLSIDNIFDNYRKEISSIRHIKTNNSQHDSISGNTHREKIQNAR